MTRIVRLLFTLAACGAIVYFVDLDQLLRVLSRSDYRLLLCALAVFSMDRVLMSFKWTLLLVPHAINIGVFRAWKVYSMASLYGTFLPSTVGADALRVADLNRQGEDLYAASASIVVERVIGFAVGCLLALASLLHFAGKLSLEQSFQPSLIAVAMTLSLCLLAFILFLVFRHNQSIPWLSKLRRLLTDRLAKLRSAHRVYGSARLLLIQFGFLTLLEQVLSLAMGYLIILALRVDIGFLDFVAALAVGMFVSRLPLTIDGLGVLEGTVGGMLVWSGVSLTDTLAVLLIGRLMNIASFVPGAVLYSLHDSKSSRERVSIEQSS